MPLEPMSEDLMQGLDADRMSRFPGYAPEAMQSLATNAKQDLYPGDFQRQPPPETFLGAQLPSVRMAQAAPAEGGLSPQMLAIQQMASKMPSQFTGPLNSFRTNPRVQEMLGSEEYKPLNEVVGPYMGNEITEDHVKELIPKLNSQHLPLLEKLYAAAKAR